MAVNTTVCDFGREAPNFSLPSTDGSKVTLDSAKGPNGVLIMFICNHCPYVVSAIERIVADAKVLQDSGIGVAAICANDARSHPEDSFENMKNFSREHNFCFPYMHDETQSVARDYGAECTPDFFGFNSALELQYRGRLDSAGSGRPDGATIRELRNAMLAIAESGKGPENQVPSMGCSIKWK
ncbi:MAG: thioredoxin family protein [Rhodobacteraceae bacterium]|nr:thioredoxin family protein [Paracoccaceae bacterium]